MSSGTTTITTEVARLEAEADEALDQGNAVQYIHFKRRAEDMQSVLNELIALGTRVAALEA